MEKSQKTSAPGAVLLSLQASGFAVMVLVLLVTGAIVLSPTLSILAEQQQEISSLEVALLESQQEVFDLEEQRERWKDPAFVETQARERLLFVYPGDITYLVIDDVGEDAKVHDIAVSTTLLAASTDWREALLASYLVAATTSRGSPTPDDVMIPSPGQRAP
jgi:cell division protein FtsB